MSGVKTNGLFNTLFNTSTIDETTITKYNTEITKATANGATMAEKQQIMKTAMEGTNKATAQLIESTKGAIVETEALTAAQKASTIAAKAGSVALKALSVAMNIVANIGLSILISKIAEAFTANERLLSSAKELGEEFKSTKSDIDSYKTKIKDLCKTINDSNSSIENVTEARKNLMAIQNELIEKFGTEKETIEIITDAINNQSDALDSLTKKQYQQWKNNFNNKDFGTSVSDFFSSRNIEFAFDKLTALDFSGAWEALTYPTESNISKMVNSMQHAYYTLKKTGNDTLDSLIQKTYHLNLGGDGSSFVLSGNLNDVYKTLIEIQELANDFNVSASFETNATKLANGIDKTLKLFNESYDIYVLYEKILDSSEDNPYDEQFYLINKAKEKFDEASILGNTDKIKEASDEYAQTLQSAIDLAIGNWDQDVADYFKSMYPELRQMFGEWKFNLNFEPNTDGLKDRVTNALDAIDGVSDGNASFHVEDIESFNLNTATQEQIEAYGDLNNAAVSYGLTLKQLIALLQTMGLVQSESYQQLVDTFGQENVNKLLPEELEIAYQIKNISDMTFDELQAEIEKIKEIVDEPISFSIILTNSTDSLDKFQSSVKSAADAYTTLLTGNYSSSELLDSIQAINKAVSDMGKAIDWESIAASDNPLKAIQDEIESVSNTYAESVLNGAGLNTNSDFGQMLANIVQEAYKSEAALKSLNTQIDSLQSAYDDLTDIVATYNETGYITFDQLQTLLEMEPQYLTCLIDENGQLQLNEAAMQTLANQRLKDARAQAVQQAITELGELTFKKEQAAIDDNRLALADNMETITTYEQRLLDLIPTVGLTTDEFVMLSNAINGAMGNCASDEDIDAVIENLNTKLQLIDRVGSLSFTQNSAKDYADKLKDELSDLNNVISYINNVIGDQIDLFNDQKNTAVDALEAERNAAEEALEAEKALVQEKIDAKQAEIDAIEEAAKARKNEIDLQKAQYDLERMQNQKTSLVHRMPDAIVI